MKRREWDRIRRQLKAAFEKKGVVFCQMCGSHSGGPLGLSFAHPRKRRELSEEEKGIAALLCTFPCHQRLEHGPREVMYETVMRLYKQVFETA